MGIEFYFKLFAPEQFCIINRYLLDRGEPPLAWISTFWRRWLNAQLGLVASLLLFGWFVDLHNRLKKRAFLGSVCGWTTSKTNCSTVKSAVT